MTPRQPDREPRPAPAHDPDAFVVVQGQVGQVQGRTVGVVWIAHDGTSALVASTGEAGGVAWETAFEARAGNVVPLGGTPVEVAAIQPPRGDTRGEVLFRARQSTTSDGATIPEAPSDVVVLPSRGNLRLDGPAVFGATDLSLLAWHPDERHPASVTVDWFPAEVERDEARPEEVTTRELRTGDAVLVGRAHVTVAGLWGATDQHPAWLVLRLAPR